MKHLLHLSILWTICHFMSIQTTNVTCIQRCLLRFLTRLGCFCNCHCSLFLLLSTCLHIMISHSIICVKFVSLPCIIMCFSDATYFVLCGTNNALLTFSNSHPFFTQYPCPLMMSKCWPLHPRSHNFEVWLQTYSKHSSQKIVHGWYL
jgi:hypothetical protein